MEGPSIACLRQLNPQCAPDRKTRKLVTEKRNQYLAFATAIGLDARKSSTQKQHYNIILRVVETKRPGSTFFCFLEKPMHRFCNSALHFYWTLCKHVRQSKARNNDWCILHNSIQVDLQAASQTQRWPVKAKPRQAGRPHAPPGSPAQPCPAAPPPLHHPARPAIPRQYRAAH